MPTVIVNKRGEDRIESGHPWVYRSDIAEVRAGAGDIVRVSGPRNRVLGEALFSDRSQIIIRMLTRGEARADEALLRRRLEQAIAFRETLKIEGTAYRLIHGEADLLPSLVVDRYGDYLVLQALSQGMDALTPRIVSLLAELMKPKGILARNDPKVRQLEGLEQKVEVLLRRRARHDRGDRRACSLRRGSVPRAEDRAVPGSAREPDRGGATTRPAGCSTPSATTAASRWRSRRSARRSSAIDISEDAVARIRSNAERNGLKNVQARAMNVFDELRELERRGEQFDTIVLDPPAFAKNKASVPKALSGYKEINLRGIEAAEARRIPRDLQLFVQRRRVGVRGRHCLGRRRRPRRRDGRREAHAGARSSGADDRA